MRVCLQIVTSVSLLPRQLPPNRKNRANNSSQYVRMTGADLVLLILLVCCESYIEFTMTILSSAVGFIVVKVSVKVLI